MLSPEIPVRPETSSVFHSRPPEGESIPSTAPQAPTGEVTRSQAKSYSGALTGIPAGRTLPAKPWISVGENDIVTVISDGVRALRLSQGFKDKLCKPWSNSVVVRLIGKSIGYSYMCNRLNAMWKPQGSMQVIDVDLDCYLVRFGEERDYFRALTGGPWLIFDHYLVVQQWDPSFRVSSKLPSKMVVWVRFPHLPIQLYHNQILTSLGNLIGKTVRMDYNTQSAVRGKFARIAVEIDLNEPVATGVELDDSWQRIEYENLPELCFGCGKVGHHVEACPMTSRLTEGPGALTEGVETPHIRSTVDTSPESPPTDSYGAWLTVTRKGRRPRKEGSPDKERSQLKADSADQSIQTVLVGKSTTGKGKNQEEGADRGNNSKGKNRKLPSPTALHSKEGKEGPTSNKAHKVPVAKGPNLKKNSSPNCGVGTKGPAPEIPHENRPVSPSTDPIQPEPTRPVTQASTSGEGQGPIAAHSGASVSPFRNFSIPPDSSSSPSDIAPRSTQRFCRQKRHPQKNTIPPVCLPKKSSGKKRSFPREAANRRVKMGNPPASTDTEMAADSNSEPQADIGKDLHIESWLSHGNLIVSLISTGRRERRPKSQGGLGLKKARELNGAYMMKLGWLILQKPEKLWVQVLSSKYLKQTEQGLKLRRKTGGSVLWRGIRKLWPSMAGACQHSIRNGASTLFWQHKWLDSGVRLSDLASLPLDDSELERTVAGATTDQGDWNWTLLKELLPPHCLEQIAGMDAPENNDADDEMIWGPDPKGKFSIASAYEILAANQSETEEYLWKIVWRWKGPNRIKFFLWLATHNRLLTNLERKKRHMTDSDSCRLCPGLAEDGLHVLRDCNSARAFWKAFLPPDRFASFFVGDFHDWLSNSLNDTEHGLQNGIAMWLLWKARNEDIFEGRKVSSDQLRLRVHSWIAGVRETMRASSNLLSKMVERRRETLISWIPAPDDWTTVNTDGSVIQPLSLAAGGIVIRDSGGATIAAFAANFGRCSIMRAELRAAALGLERAGSWGSGRFRFSLTPKRRSMLSTTTGTRADDITRLSTESGSSAIVTGMFIFPIFSERVTASRTFLLMLVIP
ncbi:Putative ribonuclease H protein At1g65750 [Linum perenne]